MYRSLPSIVADLQAFVPDDDEADNVVRLTEILSHLDPKDRAQACSAMFSVIERNPVAGLGNPGPLVHELEQTCGYETMLVDALVRAPSFLLVWMANRALNGAKTILEREQWLRCLNDVVQSQVASDQVKEMANGFITRHLGM